MSVDAQPRWFDAQAIGKALEREAAPDAAELRDILNKSLELQPLSMDETVALMRVQDGVGVGRIMAAADEVKQKVYGDRSVLSAPLWVSELTISTGRGVFFISCCKTPRPSSLGKSTSSVMTSGSSSSAFCRAS